MPGINAVLLQNTSSPQVDRNVTTVRQTVRRFFDVVVASLLIAIVRPGSCHARQR